MSASDPSSPAAGRAPVGLALAAFLLAALAVLPGCLGFLVFTHTLTATPAGAWFVYVAAIPLYALSALLLLAAFILARRRRSRLRWVVLSAVAFGGVSLFGFLMHTGFLFRPVTQPEYVSLDEAIHRFGESEPIVGVLDGEGRPYAYIARLARRPHIVQQPEGDAPFMMSHCILANSSMAYALDPDAPPPHISISSVLANNLIYYDHGTKNTVQQVYNCSLDGRDRLTSLPTVTTTLAAWQTLYPESKVWVRPREWRDTFYLKLLARASVIDQQSPDLVYPLQRPADPRLPLKAYVMGVQSGDESCAYPLDALVRDGVLQDDFAGRPLVFFASSDGEFVQLYSRRVPGDGRVLNFTALPDGSAIRDGETGSRWDVAGRCIAGELRGTRLAPVPHYSRIFWCVWADFSPKSEVRPRS
ncbi:MAG: DUF3179 domain-containing (seleno)protein [Opitutaceae bacterium]|nr:DUF3179 domain-containing (seleno)protein [Opitutaceae bacterium]